MAEQIKKKSPVMLRHLGYTAFDQPDAHPGRHPGRGGGRDRMEVLGR